MISAAAEVQRRLWGTDPRAWAELAESHNRPLFEAVLDAAAVDPGMAVLDVGCGSGLTLVLAAERGAVPSGVDISPGLLAIARDRLPHADLREADMESLPFGDAAFDAVTGVNAFQFAGRPAAGATRGGPRHPARRPRGGQPVRGARTVPGHARARGHDRAHSARTSRRSRPLRPLCPWQPGGIPRIRRPDPRRQRRGRVPWRYASMDEAIRALLCSAGGARAAEAAGPQAVRDALRPALAQFQDPQTGAVTLDNTFRWVAAHR